jgi:hypothetical protein
MNVMKLAAFMQKKPTDKTIISWRIIFGIIYIFLMWYNLIYLWKPIDDVYLNFSFFWWELFPWLKMNWQEILIFKYILTWIWIIPILMWIFNICLFKKKYVRIIQIIFWIFLFYIAWIIKDSPTLDFDFIIWFMWLLPLIAWITGKCITTKCQKFWEKIIKIRV